MYTNIAKWLLIAASTITFSLLPIKSSYISQESPDIGLFKKKPGESIESFIQGNNDDTFDSLQYRLVKEQIEPDNDAQQINGKTYAILLNGNYDVKDEGFKRFENNIKKLYSALKKIGLKDSDIIVVQDVRSGKYKNRQDPTRQGLDDAFLSIDPIITANDLLIFYTTNHGYDSGGEGIRYSNNLKGSVLTEDDLLSIAQKSRAGAVWMINATCNGYLVTSKSTGNMIGHSFCGPRKNAVGGATVQLSETLEKSLLKKSPVDMDKDGKISIGEVAKYTALTYKGTSKQGINGTNKRKREVHHLTSQNADPDRIYLLRSVLH